MTLRKSVSAVLLVLLGSTSTLAMADSPPSAPGDLRASLYNGAGGEIFWNRSTDDNGVGGYEVTKNGQIIGTFDALSYYDASLNANTSNTFTVTAIDFSGQRSATQSVSIGSMPTNIGASTAPAGLQASVYSSSSVELFWERPSEPGLSYEVSRDGMVVATTNGVSHYAAGLEAGRDYAYQVIAINSAGQRSSAASINVTTSGGSATTTTTPVTTTPVTTTPTTPVTVPTTTVTTLPEIVPQDLSISIYSSTAAELFWTPAGSARPRIFENQIRRNGELIATVEGEFLRSYFDETREPGQLYTYEVTAVSSAGSASATISDDGATVPQVVVAPTTTTSATELPDALRASLDTSFEIINGVPVEKVLAVIGRFADRDVRSSLGLVLNGSRFNSNGSLADVYTCPMGGELLDSQDVNARGIISSELEIIDCAIGPIVFSAFSQLNTSSESTEFRSLNVFATDIELVDARDLSTIKSDSIFYFTRSEFTPEFANWTGFDVSVDRPLNSYSSSIMDGNGQDMLNALPDGSFGFTANTREIDGVLDGTAELTTLGPMEFANGRENAAPSAGRISISSESESLLIDAFNGDADTFTLTSTIGETTTSYTLEFSDTYRFEAPMASTVNVGF